MLEDMETKQTGDRIPKTEVKGGKESSSQGNDYCDYCDYCIYCCLTAKVNTEKFSSDFRSSSRVDSPGFRALPKSDWFGAKRAERLKFKVSTYVPT